MIKKIKHMKRGNRSLSSSFNFAFWVNDYDKRFNLDREAKEILDYFVAVDPKNAEEFIRDKYQREVWKLDIVDTYYDKFEVVKINKLLKELDFEYLTEEEIEEYKTESNENEI